MTAQDVVAVAARIDRLVVESRLRDVRLLLHSDRAERIAVMCSVISRLGSGAYLVGCGPYCCGVLPLSVAAVVLGRPPSPLEAPPRAIADYTLNDAVFLVPREASRIHATVLRRPRTNAPGHDHDLRDEGSRTGTFVNDRRVGGDDARALPNPTRLASGDEISLGPSGVNTYVFVEIP